MDRSVRQSVDPVRRGIHGPGVSVFGSPFLDTENEKRRFLEMENLEKWGLLKVI